MQFHLFFLFHLNTSYYFENYIVNGANLGDMAYFTSRGEAGWYKVQLWNNFIINIGTE